MQRSRIKTYDIAKGICISFVVAGHAYAPFSIFYVSFHVLFFFILSGVFFLHDNVNNFSNLKKYIFKIWKRYGLPYSLCNIIFLCFYNVFIKLGLIANDFKSYNTLDYIDFHEFIIKFLKHLFIISSSEQLCGATWFLKSLFWGLFTYSILMFFFKKIKFLVYILIFIISIFILNNCDLNNGRLIFYYIQALSMIMVGDILKIYQQFDLKYCYLIIPISILGILYVNQLQINSNKIFLYGLLGFYFVISLSKFIEKYSILSDAISYIGQNTLPILFLHFIAFKFVTYFLIKHYNFDSKLIGIFPALHAGVFASIIYTVAGILFPILASIIYKKLVNTHKFLQ